MSRFTSELNNLLKSKSCSSDEVTELAIKYKKAKTKERKDFYKQQVIENTVKLALKHCQASTGNNIENTEDHFQLAMVGILEALERFDENSKFRFSTYAVFWMRCYTSIYHHQSFAVKHPRDSYIGARKYEKIINESISSNMTIEKVLSKKRIPREKFKTWEKAFSIRNSSAGIVSLDKNISNKEGVMTIKDTLTHKGALQDAVVEDAQIIDKVKQIAKEHFNEKEQQILDYRFFQPDGVQKDYTWISKKMRMEPQTIKKIENKFLYKLKTIIIRKGSAS